MKGALLRVLVTLAPTLPMMSERRLAGATGRASSPPKAGGAGRASLNGGLRFLFGRWRVHLHISL